MDQPKQPKKSYRIWFSQRNGSTLLCKGLEQTGIAGIPGEYFNPMPFDSLCKKYDVQTYEELKHTIWELGTSTNGIFGIKHTLHTSYSQKIFDEIKVLRGMPQGASLSTEKLLTDFFPNCRHIYLTRRNKVRQAVSWWKAINDNVWHQVEDMLDHDDDFYERHYDFEALNHLFVEATLRECAMQAYFSAHGIHPKTIVYEDFVTDFRSTIKDILKYVDIECDDVNNVQMFYKRTSNSHSEKWVQRFRTDLQNKMSDKIW